MKLTKQQRKQQAWDEYWKKQQQALKEYKKKMQPAYEEYWKKREEIDAEEVVIKTAEKDIVISNPSVTFMNAMGQESYQIVGSAEERPKEKFVDDDVKIVMEKTGASEEDAKNALEEAGDIAGAILKLKS